MMINKRLIGTVAESRKYIAGNVVLQWCSLAANIAMMFSITKLLAGLYYGNTNSHALWTTAGCGFTGAPHPVFLYHWGFEDELPFFQSGQEKPCGSRFTESCCGWAPPTTSR